MLETLVESLGILLEEHLVESLGILLEEHLVFYEDNKHETLLLIF